MDNGHVELRGIAELRCWINHVSWQYPTGHDTEACLDAHRAAGINHVAWELGRSVLAYHSRLPEATCWGRHDRPGELGERPEIERMLGERCSLRVAIRHARARNMTLYGRMSMNRYYRPGFKRSRWADQHPEFMEIGKDGMVDPSRLCYGVPEVRRERIAILREAAEIGCDGLLLDFCRQPPFLRFHPALVNPWREEHGSDPADLRLADGQPYLDWCRYRADFLTGFMRELRQALDESPKLGHERVPVQVRVPNDGLGANLIAGLDIARWCEEGLVDELAPSELHWLVEYRDFDDAPYIELGRRYGLPVTTSVSFNPVQKGKCGLSRGHNPLVLARRGWTNAAPASPVSFSSRVTPVSSYRAMPSCFRASPPVANSKRCSTIPISKANTPSVTMRRITASTTIPFCTRSAPIRHATAMECNAIHRQRIKWKGNRFHANTLHRFNREKKATIRQRHGLQSVRGPGNVAERGMPLSPKRLGDSGRRALPFNGF